MADQSDRFKKLEEVTAEEGEHTVDELSPDLQKMIPFVEGMAGVVAASKGLFYVLFVADGETTQALMHQEMSPGERYVQREAFDAVIESIGIWTERTSAAMEKKKERPQ